MVLVCISTSLEHTEESVCVCLLPTRTASHFSNEMSVYLRTEHKYHIDGQRSDCVGTSVLSLQALQICSLQLWLQ